MNLLPRQLVSGFAALLCLSLGLAACGSGGGKSDPAPASVSTKKLDASNFDKPATGRNPYLPLVPGMQSVRQGTTLVGGRAVPHQVTTTVTNAYRTIAGVRTVLSLDYELDGGQVSQISLDYLAEDKAGNVWLLGGYTQQYEGGRFVAAIDPWLDGVHGAQAGVLVQANPRTQTPYYTIDKPDKEADSVGQVLGVGVRHCVPFHCFNDVLVVREGKATAPDNELKYYARNVGQIDNVPHGASVHQDVEKLVNLTRLSPQALAEATKQALQLDHNAPKQAPSVFAGLPVATSG